MRELQSFRCAVTPSMLSLRPTAECRRSGTVFRKPQDERFVRSRRSHLSIESTQIIAARLKQVSNDRLRRRVSTYPTNGIRRTPAFSKSRTSHILPIPTNFPSASANKIPWASDFPPAVSIEPCNWPQLVSAAHRGGFQIECVNSSNARPIGGRSGQQRLVQGLVRP